MCYQHKEEGSHRVVRDDEEEPDRHAAWQLMRAHFKNLDTANKSNKKLNKESPLDLAIRKLLVIPEKAEYG